eukprot:scaffold97820_cov56-Attheya_sp.AAC.3
MSLGLRQERRKKRLTRASTLNAQQGPEAASGDDCRRAKLAGHYFGWRLPHVGRAHGQSIFRRQGRAVY